MLRPACRAQRAARARRAPGCTHSDVCFAAQTGPAQLSSPCSQPAACKSSDTRTVCGACIDALLKVFTSKARTRKRPSCNTAALRACDPRLAAPRLLNDLRCVGAKPPAADLVPELTIPGSP